MYVLSFFLPAAELGTSNQLEPGWKAAEVAYVALLVVLSHPALDVMIVALWGLTNVLMLLSPIPVIRARRPKSVTLACLAMTIATCVNALALSDRRRHHLGVGYYLWLSAFGLLALALLRRRQEQSLKI